MRKLIKGIYNSIPFKKQIFLILRKFWKPSASIYQHMHFKGIIRVPVDPDKSFRMVHYGYEVENHLFWAGVNSWEKQSMGLWIKLCRQAEVIFDIGANTGVYALIAKTINNKASVFAFEPVERIFKKLFSNVSINGYDIVCVNKAVSDKDGIADMYEPDTEHTYTVTINRELFNNSGKAIIKQVETVALESFIDAHQLKKVNLMKIDVEMHEPEVMKGLGAYLAKFKPAILIEILTDEIGQKIQSFTQHLGYLYFNIDEEKGVRKVEQITKSDHFNYLLCDTATARSIQLI